MRDIETMLEIREKDLRQLEKENEELKQKLEVTNRALGILEKNPENSRESIKALLQKSHESLALVYVNMEKQTFNVNGETVNAFDLMEIILNDIEYCKILLTNK